MRYLDLSLATSGKLNIRWTHGFVLEIMGLVQRGFGNYERALELFQESLHPSVEQENQQGIANCLGALAGLAVMAGEPRRAARLFAAAPKLRREMGAKMSSNDRHEYEQYLDLVHEKLDHAAFDVEWSEGFSMTTQRIIEDLTEWLGGIQSRQLSDASKQTCWKKYSTKLCLSQEYKVKGTFAALGELAQRHGQRRQGTFGHVPARQAGLFVVSRRRIGGMRIAFVPMRRNGVRAFIQLGATAPRGTVRSMIAPEVMGRPQERALRSTLAVQGSRTTGRDAAWRLRRDKSLSGSRKLIRDALARPPRTFLL